MVTPSGHVVWIGLHEPSLELLRLFQAEFGLHPLAIEDALKAHQRPKLEQYGDALFVVARTSQMVERRIAFGETHIFVGRGYVLSVRHGASTSYTPVRERCEASPKALSDGEDFILYAILDFIVDNYMPVIEAIQAEAEEIEPNSVRDPIVGSGHPPLPAAARPRSTSERCRSPGRGLQASRTAGLPGIDPSMQPLFRDVLDHIRRVQGGDQIAPRGVGLRVRDQSHDRPSPADRSCATARGLGGYSGRTDCRCRHLWHELRAYAGASMAVRLFSGARVHRRRLQRPVLALSKKRLAVTSGTEGQTRPTALGPSGVAPPVDGAQCSTTGRGNGVDDLFADSGSLVQAPPG